ncbi:tetratricopeptide repeat protein [bacterium]|nr:tetratricopeptide repeat protein [bacterium]MBU1983050.1 tetratricopeptide repeat protein [bacterium]
MRTLTIFFALLLFCLPGVVAQSNSTMQADSLSGHIQQQLDSIKLELQAAELQRLAEQTDTFRGDVTHVMEWTVGLIGGLIGLITIFLAISGVYWLKSQRQLREAIEAKVKETCTKIEDSLDTSIHAIFVQKQQDVRESINKIVETLSLPVPVEQTCEDDQRKLRKVSDEIRRLEQMGGTLTARDHLLRARKWMDDGLFMLALDAYNAAVTKDEKFMDAWFGQGYCLLHLDRFGEAIEAFDMVLEIKSDNFEALFNKGICFLKSKLYKEALEACKEALWIKTNHFDTLLLKGGCLAELKEYDDAIQTFDILLSRQSDDHRVIYNKARVYAMKGDKPAMLKALSDAIRYNNGYCKRVRAQDGMLFKPYWEDPDFQNVVCT